MRCTVGGVVQGHVAYVRGRYIDHGMLGRIERELGSSLRGQSTNQVVVRIRGRRCVRVCRVVVGDIGGKCPRASRI